MVKNGLTKESISIFFPCYNDRGTIGKLIIDAFNCARRLTDDFEIIVVDDGSTDESPQILSSLSKKYDWLKVIFHEKNKGYGAALRTGFSAASKNLVFYTDGDGQYDPKELELLSHLMTSDVNFVNGIKMERQDYGYRVIVGNLYNLVVRWSFMLPIFDTDCDFRLIRKSLLNKLNLTSNSGSICVELVKKAQIAGGKFRQVSVHHFERSYGHSQFFKPMKIIQTLLDVVNLWMRLFRQGALFK